MPTLSTDEDHRIDRIEDWVAGDSHRIAFTVTQDGTPRDITDDEISWRLSRRPYQRTDTVLDDSAAGIEVVTDTRVDTTNGEFEVRIDEGVTSDNWGEYWATVVVDPPGDSKQSWLGAVAIESA